MQDLAEEARMTMVIVALHEIGFAEKVPPHGLIFAPDKGQRPLPKMAVREALIENPPSPRFTGIFAARLLDIALLPAAGRASSPISFPLPQHRAECFASLFSLERESYGGPCSSLLIPQGHRMRSRHPATTGHQPASKQQSPVLNKSDMHFWLTCAQRAGFT